jgi:hypothetical protein
MELIARSKRSELGLGPFEEAWFRIGGDEHDTETG